MGILQVLLLWPLLVLASAKDVWSQLGNAIYENTFQPELEQISRHASALRNGIDNIIAPGGEGGWGYVVQVRFSDGVIWAAKLSEAGNRWDMLQATIVLDLVERSCPNIPIPKIHGTLNNLENSTLIYYLTDWIEGHPLREDPEYRLTPSGPSSYQINLPDKVITQLAEFLYNITTCRIPFAKMSKLISENYEPSGKRLRIPDISTWVSEHFAHYRGLLTSAPSPPPYTGLDRMLLLSWLLEQFTGEAKYHPFVLHYWDLRAKNIMVDDDLNVAGVRPVPLKLAALSLEDRLVSQSDWFDDDYVDLQLDPEQTEFFHQEVSRIEKERPWIYSLSELYRSSRENLFLERLTTKPHWNFALLNEHHSELLSKALERSPEALSAAASEWAWFKYAWFHGYRRPVPDWPAYIEIQEGLGIYGRTWYHRFGRRIKRLIQELLLTTTQHVCRYFDGWEWVVKKRRYLSQILISTYHQ